MTALRKPVFDAWRAAVGTLSQPMVDEVGALLTKHGVPDRDSRKLRDLVTFFAAVRKITGPLDNVQVAVINALLASAAHHPASWLAYELATAWHEARLKPIEEWGKGKGLKYGAPGKHGGQVAYGRGLVQLTWDWNYEKADKELGLNGALTRDYRLALDPAIAVRIMVEGMEAGWFTGKSLATYLPEERGLPEQFKAARRIINGTDKADLIAGYAQQFQAALTVGGWA